MIVIRPIEPTDYAGLHACAVESGHGFTSLPVDETLLRGRIERSLSAFNQADVKTPGPESYLFVAADTETGQIAGVSGIEAAVGLSDAFYHYHLGKVVHHSPRHNVYNALETLTLCNDYTGVTELCTLFLRQNFRENGNGKALSRFRMLFLAEFRQRFAEQVIAEMRGVSDENGLSPFWAWLEKHFFTMDFPRADYLTGVGEKTFIAELMPKFPIYVNLLDDAAREVIGEVHPNTLPALKLLTSEGFRFRGYVDIFDAGPTVEADIEQLRSVRHSAVGEVQLVDSLPASEVETVIACNRQLAEFRACQAELSRSPVGDTFLITTEVAKALGVSSGDSIRVAPL